MVNYTSSELMVVRASRELKNKEVVFVGVGLPNLACNLARRFHAPDLFLIYEAGAIGATPSRLPLSIGDPALVTNSLSVCSLFEVFFYYLQGGIIDVAFLGAAQIDKFGNINTTVIGDYHNPQVRLPGSGGACEAAIHSKKVIFIMKQDNMKFRSKINFITTPGFIPNFSREKNYFSKRSSSIFVITNLGVYKFFEDDNSFHLLEIYPNISLSDIKKNVSWRLKVSPELKISEPPSDRELRILREELDPMRTFI